MSKTSPQLYSYSSFVHLPKIDESLGADNSSTPCEGDRVWGEAPDLEDDQDGEDEDGDGDGDGDSSRGDKGGTDDGKSPFEIDIPLDLFGEFSKTK